MSAIGDGVRVACVGGAHIDVKARVVGDATLGTSNPAQVSRTPGGVACNVARNLAYLGVSVSLFSVVGDDPWARMLLGSLHGAGVDTSGILRAVDPPTASYLAVLDREGRLVLAVADMEVYEGLDADWARLLAPQMPEFDAIVLDANVPAPALEVLAGAAGDALLVADPVSIPKASRLERILPRVDVIFPDRAEAVALAGLPGENVSAASAAEALRRRGPGTVVVSLGIAGAYLDDGVHREHVSPNPVQGVVDVTGAGDAQIAGYLYGMAAAGNHVPPIRWAMAMAGLTLETIDSVRDDLTPDLLLSRLSG